MIDACRAHGMRSVNVDLIYGLPKQTPRGIRAHAGHRGRRAPRPHGGLQLRAPAEDVQARSGRSRRDDLPDAGNQARLLQLAIERLTAAGYVYIGMDHFALPDDELAMAQARGGLHRNFMGYTTHADSDLIGLGVSAISHIGDSFSQNPRDLPSVAGRASTKAACPCSAACA